MVHKGKIYTNSQRSYMYNVQNNVYDLSLTKSKLHVLNMHVVQETSKQLILINHFLRSQEGGVWSLLDLLSDPEVRESVRGEVAGVIAQVTSPCLENVHQMSGLIDNMEDLLIHLLGTVHQHPPPIKNKQKTQNLIN